VCYTEVYFVLQCLVAFRLISIARCCYWCIGDRDERLRTMEEELTSQIDKLSTVVKQKVAFNDTSELLTFDT